MEGVKTSLGSVLSSVSETPNQHARINQKEDPSMPSANSLLDCASIHFDYSHSSVSEIELRDFSNRIDDELEGRNLPESDREADETLQDRVERLREILKKEYKYRKLSQQLARGTELENSVCLFSILDAVPCSKFLTLYPVVQCR
jgi:hypothetical protein